MRAEIIAIGSELLLGQSVDTNGPWIAQKLSQLGIDCHFKSVVGDNIQNIVSTLNLARSRADIIICTGGLGPTQDDITKEALAEALNTPLIYDTALAEVIRKKFIARKRTMTENNLRQAYYPKGAEILKTHPGTAPGIHYHDQASGQHLFLLPGVPTEMKLMMRQSVLPLLKELTPTEEEIYFKTLRCWGVGESNLAELLSEINDELDEKSNPKLSFLASGIEGIQVRFSAKAASYSEAMHLIKPYQKRAEILLGELLFGYDDESMESVVKALLIASNKRLALYETFSRGLISERLNRKSDTREFFHGSLVESDRRQPHDEEDLRHRLNQVQSLFAADLVLTVLGRPFIDQNRPEESTIELTLALYSKEEGLEQKSLIIPYFNHDATVDFSVINSLNFLRRTLLKELKE